MYVAPKKAIFSIVNPLSINKPNTAVPKAVENTINAVVNALILPMNLTPYISAQVDEPRIFANPLDTPINPKNTYANISFLKYKRVSMANNNGKFI